MVSLKFFPTRISLNKPNIANVNSLYFFSSENSTKFNFPIVEYVQSVRLFEIGQLGIIRSNYIEGRDSINKYSSPTSISWPR